MNGDFLPVSYFPRKPGQLTTFRNSLAVNADNQGNMRRFLTLDHMAISKRHKGMVINYRVAVSNFELTDHKAVSMTISLPWMRNYLVNKGPMWNIGPVKNPLWGWGGYEVHKRIHDVRKKDIDVRSIMDHPEQKEKLKTIQYIQSGITAMQDLVPNNIDE